MTYVRQVTETDFYNGMCLYFQFGSICILLSLFELVILLSTPFNAFKVYILLLHVFQTCYSKAGVGYIFYPLSFYSANHFISSFN